MDEAGADGPDDGEGAEAIDPVVAVAPRHVDVADSREPPSPARVWHSWHATAFSLGATMWVVNPFMRVSMKPNLPL